MTLDLSRLGAWRDLPFFTGGFAPIQDALRSDPRVILPPAEQIFAALERTQPQDARVVILGQDPYPTPGHAHGLAFSVGPEIKLPHSLRNIFKEMKSDLGARPPNGDLRFWADQGVLLLNTVLTVPAGEANGHKDLGWQDLTAQVLARLSDRPRAYLLWGKQAQKTAQTGPDDLRIATAHPSPLSARQGFFGSRPFSRVNAWLASRGEAPINWAGPG